MALSVYTVSTLISQHSYEIQIVIQDINWNHYLISVLYCRTMEQQAASYYWYWSGSACYQQIYIYILLKFYCFIIWDACLWYNYIFFSPNNASQYIYITRCKKRSLHILWRYFLDYLNTQTKTLLFFYGGTNALANAMEFGGTL